MTKKYSKGAYGAGTYSSDETESSSKIYSWSFSVDGHPFVAVNLGVEGTVVFDASSGEWFDWSQRDRVGLGFTGGQDFQEFNLLADSVGNTVYTFDPEELDDTTGIFKTVVTGGISARGRETLRCFAVFLEGNRSDTSRAVNLLASDNNGATWQSYGVIFPSGMTDAQWRSLGAVNAPGRLFSIEDYGSFKGIDALVVDNGS